MQGWILTKIDLAQARLQVYTLSITNHRHRRMTTFLTGQVTCSAPAFLGSWSILAPVGTSPSPPPPSFAGETVKPSPLPPEPEPEPIEENSSLSKATRNCPPVPATDDSSPPAPPTATAAVNDRDSLLGGSSGGMGELDVSDSPLVAADALGVGSIRLALPKGFLPGAAAAATVAAELDLP